VVVLNWVTVVGTVVMLNWVTVVGTVVVLNWVTVVGTVVVLNLVTVVGTVTVIVFGFLSFLSHSFPSQIGPTVVVLVTVFTSGQFESSQRGVTVSVTVFASRPLESSQRGGTVSVTVLAGGQDDSPARPTEEEDEALSVGSETAMAWTRGMYAIPATRIAANNLMVTTGWGGRSESECLLQPDGRPVTPQARWPIEYETRDSNGSDEAKC